MRWNIQFIVQRCPGNEEAFWDRLESLSQQKSFYAPFFGDIPPPLLELQQHEIKQCVVGPNHLAFLLGDGRVCRIQYSSSEGQSPKLSSSQSDVTNDSSRKSGERPPKMSRSATSPWIVSAADLSSSAPSSLRKWGSHIGVIRSMASHSSTSSTSSSSQRRRAIVNDSSVPLNSTSAVRLVRTSQLRGRGLGLQSSLITGHRVIVPASHVPEELVTQVQGILQGKSRSIIVRELQRTSLDVNLAVNNLLSRDDEDNDDGDDNGSDYMPGEDLLSLLDSGVNPGDHGVFIDADILPEDLLGYTLSRTPRSLTGARGTAGRDGSGKDAAQDRDPIIRLRSPRILDARRYCLEQEEEARRDKPVAKDKETKSGKASPAINLGSEFEWWMEGEDFVKFIYIGGMYSELNAVDVDGNLRQWRWKKRSPFHHPSNPQIFHPRTTLLGLESKKIAHLASCSLRASALTEDGGVCTWIDECAAHRAAILEQPVTTCLDPDLAMQIGSDKHEKLWNRCLFVSSIYSAVLAPAGDVYAWGMIPFSLRKTFLEDALAKIKKTMKNKSSSDEIKVGSMVQLNKCPIYQTGAIAINPNRGQPKVGRLLQPVWSLSETCPFKVMRRKFKKRSKSSSKEHQSGTLDKGDDNDTQPAYEADGNRDRETVVKSTIGTPSNPAGNYSRKRKYTELEDRSEKQYDYCDSGSVPPTRIFLLFRRRDSHPGSQGSEDLPERWRVKDVFFVEDPQAFPVGKVVKIDGDMIAVLFNKPGKSPGDKISKKSLLKKMRLLRREDVRLLASEALPKMPDCIMKKPKKLQIPPNVRLHTLCATDEVLEGIEGGVEDSPVRLVTIGFCGSVDGETLPTSADMFLDGKEISPATSKVSLHHHQKGAARLLLDNKSCLYPLLQSENSGIRDPRWININPIVTLAAGTHLTSKQRHADKDDSAKKYLVYVMVFRSHRLMPALMHRNLETVQAMLSFLTQEDVEDISQERCDGMRNVIHVAASLSCPTSNPGKSRKTSGGDGKAARSDARLSSPKYHNVGDIPIPARTAESSAASKSSDSSSQNARVNAIANAISVVTRNEGGEPRFLMRDIMQQFAAVLDDSSPRSRSQPAAPSSGAPSWQPPYPAHENFRMYEDVTISLPVTMPTTTWPPDPAPEVAPVSTVNSCLNLSTRMSCAASKDVKTPSEREADDTRPSSSDINVQFAKKRGSTADGLAILKELLSCEAFKPALFEMLSQRDGLGHTPFVSAVYNRGYPAAVEILKAAMKIARGRAASSTEEDRAGSSSGVEDIDDAKYFENLMAMLFPNASDLDSNPLYLVCVSDTCSFTWTGAQHINQDIYECLTCGLTGTLCCCSECARICHNGHDCKLKRTSPTAYCDCWEKCACRSLIAGDAASRTELLQLLVNETDLIDLVNNRGETLLQFLANTVARQSVEQRQHRSRGSSRNSGGGKTTFSGRELNVPQHDLQPPTFCRDAFLSLLQNWKCVRSTVMASYDKKLARGQPAAAAAFDASSVLLPEEELCLYSQTGTSRLDAFLLCLIVKCNVMYLDTMLETLINQMQKADDKEKKDRDFKIVHGLVRSLVRTFIVISICSSPDCASPKFMGRSLSTSQPLKRLQRAFNALAPVAIKELTEMATALIDPVRLGVAVPTAQFSFLASNSEVISSCEAAFASPPFRSKQPASKRKHKTSSKKKKAGSKPPTTGPKAPATQRPTDPDEEVADRGNSSGVAFLDALRHNILTPLSSEHPPGHRDFIAAWESLEARAEEAEQDENDIEQDSYVETPMNDDPIDTVVAEEHVESQDRVESAGSMNDVFSEGDLDMDDEDGGDDNNVNNDDESDMDLTLLAGSDADTDVGTDFSGDENDDKDKEEDEDDARHPLLVFSEISDNNQDEDDDDDDDDNQEDDTEDGEDNENEQQESTNANARTQHENDDDDDDDSSSDDDDHQNNRDEDAGFRGDPNFALERPATRTQRSTASQAPQSMRWALGGGSATSGPGRAAQQREATRRLLYPDHPQVGVRRNNATMLDGDSGDASKQSNQHSTTTSNAQLARAFGICVREAAKLISSTWQGEHKIAPLSTFLDINCEDVRGLKDFADRTLSETWKWLLTVVDSTEAQLRYGQVLSLAGSPGPSVAPTQSRSVRSFLERPGGVTMFSKSSYSRSAREQETDSSKSRQDFLKYALSLMRGHTGEHGGYLPVVNVSSMKHVAYCLDALVFYLRRTLPVMDGNEKTLASDRKDKERRIASALHIGYCTTDDEDDEDSSPLKQDVDMPQDELFSIAVSDVLVGGIIANAQRKIDPAGSYAHPQKTFFRRSESMTFLGSSESDTFSEPLAKTLPLADKPHLLQPNARKEELFGRMRNQLGGIDDALLDSDESYFDPEIAGIGMGRLKHKMHLKFDKMRQRRTQEKMKKQLIAESDQSAEKNATNTASVITASNPAEKSGNQADADDRAMEVESASATDAAKKERSCKFLPTSVDSLLARCCVTMELFTKVFLEDVGAEPGSILQELGGFEVREAKFRKDMEKLRNSQSVDLLLNVERDPHRLVLDAFKQLNQHYKRRTGASSMSVSCQPLTVLRVKVIFKDEPGEGSGVSRSFYTALCETLLSSNPLPPLDEILVAADHSGSRRSSGSKRKDHDSDRLGRPGGKKVNLRSYFMARYAMQSSPSSGKTSFSTMASAAPPFRKLSQGGRKSEFDSYKRALGGRLYPKVNAINSKWPRKITGILLVQPISDLLMLLNNESMLKASVQDASRYLTSVNYAVEPEDPDADPEQSSPDDSANAPQSKLPAHSEKKDQCSDSEGNDEEFEVDVSTFPLFYQPGKRGFYSPAAGPSPKDAKDGAAKSAPGREARLNAFRNVGRIIGLCLLQNELCPLPLNRHVLKALLGRKINWYDFAFFDPALYESMRFILAECEKEDGENLFDSLDLSFSADILYQEGGGQVDLIPDGASVPVTKHNVLEYVRKYAIYRMITCCHKYIEQMRDGLLDVLPLSSLDGLSAEDLRLLLNGCGRVNVTTLISYTSFNDESGKSAGSSAEKLTEFKRWFWSVVSFMSHAARQELLYFWTGSPALPASEDGFQPLPTITIRPPDDQHLPTANTCISRLYVPLYSSRNILKKKLTLAIKTKNFGFV